MKAYLRHIIDEDVPVAENRGRVREYLQLRILQSLQRAGGMRTLAFHGGTALRILYNIPRYSEDLDFALEQHKASYALDDYLRQVEKDFLTEAYRIEIKRSQKTVVHKAMIRFPGLLYELGLSNHENEVLSVKLEIDTNPPAGATLLSSYPEAPISVLIQHHTPDSLFAGKMHALLQRRYVKGRDWYDLYWYLSQTDWPPPNLEMLNNALDQSEWSGEPIQPDEWQALLLARLAALPWSQVEADVNRFIIERDLLTNFNPAFLKKLLS